jgi:hypothetical protein
VRRTIRLIITFLLIGAVTTVAVAWTFAATIDFWDLDKERTDGGVPSPGKLWHVTIVRSMGGVQIEKLPLEPPFTEEELKTMTGIWLRQSQLDLRPWIPAWSMALSDPDDPEVFKESQWTERGFGWPCLGMRAELNSLKILLLQPGQERHLGFRTYVEGDRLMREFPTKPGAPDGVFYESVHDHGVQNGWLVHVRMNVKNYRGMQVVVIPFRPIWPAFLFNNCFYAAAAALLWLTARSPRLIRIARRRRRGLCVKCGYDLRGASSSATCPECGVHSP